MVRSHTYFLARKGQCEGALKDREPLAKALAELYEARKGEAETTIVDGASAWLDESACAHVRVIAGGVAGKLEEPEELARFAALLAGESAAIPAGESAAVSAGEGVAS
jgi:hypothetical protein